MSLLLSIFRRRRVSTGAPTHNYSKGIVFDPGAEVFAYHPLRSDPTHPNVVHPEWAFQPPAATSPLENIQTLALPGLAQAGTLHGTVEQTGLIQPSDYPSVSGTYYE